MTNNDWDPDDYRSAFGFVASYGDSVLELLDARSGERILDLGCGTGEHAAQLASTAIEVVAIDASAAMIEAARSAHPEVDFRVVDVIRDAPELGTFDAVFSNAALHWMQPQQRALGFVRACLRPGGRLVAEMGGFGNVALALKALRDALVSCDLESITIEENWFPTVGQEASLLEMAGFEVRQMQLFDRPTPLLEGSTVADWCAHFRARAWEQIPEELRSTVHARVNEIAAPELLGPQGWWTDYRRLRFTAVAI